MGNLRVKAFNPLQSFLAGQQGRTQFDENNQAQQVLQLQQQLAQQGGGLNNPITQQIAALSSDPLTAFQNLSNSRQKAFVEDASRGARFIRGGQPERALQLAQNRREDLVKLNADTSDTDFVIQGITQGMQSGDFSQVLASLDQAAGIKTSELRKSPGQREFESLLKDLPEDKRKSAILVKLGLSPRAVGNAAQTIAKDDLTDLVANSQAVIRQRTKFAEMTGSSRAKAIDKGFERLVKIDTGIRNIDKAVAALESGAGVGAIESLLPSFRAASITLDNIQKSMALDVIGAVTFGALSKGELDLAKEVALPTGLDTPQLIEHLRRKKSAQLKLRKYFNDQIQFLDQGGTIAGFLREQERNQGGNLVQPTTQPTAQVQQPQEQLSGPQVQEGATATNPQTGEKLIFRNGQWVPANG